MTRSLFLLASANSATMRSRRLCLLKLRPPMATTRDGALFPRLLHSRSSGCPAQFSPPPLKSAKRNNDQRVACLPFLVGFESACTSPNSPVPGRWLAETGPQWSCVRGRMNSAQGCRILRVRRRSPSTFLGDKPTTEDREDVPFLIGCQRMPFGDQVPLLKAATAAGSGPVLSDEDRVVPQWGLLAVIRRIGGGETLLDEFLSVRHHGVQPLPYPGIPLQRDEGGTSGESQSGSASRTIHPDRCHPSSPLFGCVVPAF